MSVIQHVAGAEMRSNRRVAHHAVLKAAQRMVVSDDVFFKHDATRQSDPPFLAFHPTSGEGKPLVLTSQITDKLPDRVRVTVNLHVATHRTHG